LTAGTPFISQSGQQYFVFSALGQTKGTTFRASLSNLPGLDNGATQQTIILIAGGIGALALLGYPLYKRYGARVAPTKPARQVQLEALARLDDAYEAGLVEHADYEAERAALKAELLKEWTTPNPSSRP
jgi:hypothetical protein